jgi:hypothetical protein
MFLNYFETDTVLLFAGFFSARCTILANKASPVVQI